MVSFRRRAACGTTYEAVSQLKPVFRPNGTVTAGNACPLNDGAAAVVIMSDTRAKELGLTPLARVVSTEGSRGCRRKSWVWARSRRCAGPLGHAAMSISDIDLFEINEAFAVQVLGSAQELGIDEDKLNVGRRDRARSPVRHDRCPYNSDAAEQPCRLTTRPSA